MAAEEAPFRHPRSLVLGRLPFPLVLAVRYLKSTRRDAFVTFLSAVAATGIAVGVAALILVMAALSGLHEQLLAQILASTPEIEVTVPPEAEEEEIEAALATARALPQVESAQQLLRGRGWLLLEGTARPVELVGFEGELPRSFPGVSTGPDETPTAPTEGLYLPFVLADRWQVAPGERVSVVSPRPTLTPFGPQPRLRTVEVAGTFRTFATDEVERAAIPLSVARSLFGTGDRVLEVATGDLRRAESVAERLAGVLPAGFEVRTWKEINRSLYFVLRLEKGLLFVAVGLIVLVAALALVVDLALVVTSKRAEIGTLGTLGATPRALRRAFLALGGLLALAGITVGTTLGVSLSWAAERYRWLSVPGQVMFVDHIPFRITAPDLALVLGSTVAVVLLASFYAAHRAAALRPIEALRR